MSDEEQDYSETTLFVLLGTLLTALIGGLSYCCKKKCKNQECDSDCGFCSFHSDNRLRATIRREIQLERTERDVESQVSVPTD